MIKWRFYLATVVCMIFMQATAIDISNRYKSPRNEERKIRKSTELIILHTTEAPAKSSLSKVSERGECHYVVTEEGNIYRIIDRDRVAFHAGRSMWNGRENVDNFSIGIECVGYHDKKMPLVQLAAIRDLVKELQKMYRLSDDKVLAHSHVAYGTPNRWQKKQHRGRKRCGMLFAMPSVRRLLDLKTRVARDPDTRAKRLIVGDPYLEKILYGKTDTMARVYANATLNGTKKEEKSGWFTWLLPSASNDGKTTQQKNVVATTSTKTPANVKPQTISSSKTKTTPKIQPKQTTAIKAAQSSAPKSQKELLAKGYKLIGRVTAKKTASSLVGSKWNDPLTFYTIRDKVIPGNQINPARIEVGMGVWTK